MSGILTLPRHRQFSWPLFMSGHLAKNAAGHLTKNASGHLVKCASISPCCFKSGKPHTVSVVMPSGGCARADGTYVLDPGSFCSATKQTSIIGSSGCADFDFYGKDYTPGDNLYWVYRLEAITLNLQFSTSTQEILLIVVLAFRRSWRREDINFCITYDFKTVTHTYSRASCDSGAFTLVSSTDDWSNLGVRCIPTSVTIA